MLHCCFLWAFWTYAGLLGQVRRDCLHVCELQHCFWDHPFSSFHHFVFFWHLVWTGNITAIASGLDRPTAITLVDYFSETDLEFAVAVADTQVLLVSTATGTASPTCGLPATPDYADGACSVARFGEIGGLAYQAPFVYASDTAGNTVRRINFAQGQFAPSVQVYFGFSRCYRS